MWSRVATSSAILRGLPSGRTCTAVPILIRSVRAAMAAATTSGAESTDRVGLKCDSAIQTASRPSRFDGVDVREGLLEGVGLAEPLPGVELHEGAKSKYVFRGCGR